MNAGVETRRVRFSVPTEVVHAGHIGIMAGGKARNVLWPSTSWWRGERCAAEIE